jgi:hypothetical protein
MMERISTQKAILAKFVMNRPNASVSNSSKAQEHSERGVTMARTKGKGDENGDHTEGSAKSHQSVSVVDAGGMKTTLAFARVWNIYSPPPHNSLQVRMRE